MEWMIMMMTYSQPAREPEREREGKYAAKDGEDARSHAFLGIENARGGKCYGTNQQGCAICDKMSFENVIMLFLFHGCFLMNSNQEPVISVVVVVAGRAVAVVVTFYRSRYVFVASYGHSRSRSYPHLTKLECRPD